MKRGLTLIELVVAIACVVILLAMLGMFIGAGCKTSIGRDLELISQENNGVMIKRHWRDRNSGECFYTLGTNANSAIYPEPCR